jgi:hypothetical protein
MHSKFGYENLISPVAADMDELICLFRKSINEEHCFLYNTWILKLQLLLPLFTLPEDLCDTTKKNTILLLSEFSEEVPAVNNDDLFHVIENKNLFPDQQSEQEGKKNVCDDILDFSNLVGNDLENELIAINFLNPLYPSPFSYPFRKIMVGGRVVEFDAFHYHSTNLVAPNNKSKKEYIDRSEVMELYRWAIKGALATRLLSTSKTAQKIPRIYFSMCAMKFLNCLICIF